MKLPMSALLYQITDTCNYTISNTDISLCYEGIHLFDPDVPELTDLRYLHFITDKDLNIYYTKILNTPVFRDCVFICLCNDTVSNFPSLYPELSIVFVFSQESFSVIFNRITNIYMRFDSWDKNLHLSLLQGCSMQQLLDITAPLLTHPMLILDLNLSVIAYLRQELEAEQFMEELVTAGYATPEVVKKLRENNIMPQNFQGEILHMAQYTSCCGLPRYSMFYPLVTAQHTVGYALVFCCHTHPSNSYQYLMDMVIENLTLYFNRDQISTRTSTENYETFLAALLEHPDISEKQIETQLTFVQNLNLTDRFQLAMVSFKEQNKIPFSFICWSLRNSFQNLKPFIYNYTLYILKDSISDPCEFTHFIPDEQLSIFLDCFSGTAFYSSVSQPFFSLTELSTAAEQCQIVQKKAATDTDKQSFYYFADYAMSHLLNEVCQKESFDRFQSPYYFLLKQYDAEHATDLCDVFMCFLENGRNINQTSNVIFMHRNTVLNKTKKAISIMGNDFDDYQTQFFFILTYLHDHQ